MGNLKLAWFELMFLMPKSETYFFKSSRILCNVDLIDVFFCIFHNYWFEFIHYCLNRKIGVLQVFDLKIVCFNPWLKTLTVRWMPIVLSTLIYLNIAPQFSDELFFYQYGIRVLIVQNFKKILKFLYHSQLPVAFSVTTDLIPSTKASIERPEVFREHSIGKGLFHLWLKFLIVWGFRNVLSKWNHLVMQNELTP